MSITTTNIIAPTARNAGILPASPAGETKHSAPSTKHFLKSLELPPDFSTPINFPQETITALDNYEPTCDSLKLKKQLTTLHLQTASLNHASLALAKLVQLTDSKKPEVARRACMSLLKLAHLHNTQSLIPDDDPLFPEDDDEEGYKGPRVQGSKAPTPKPPSPPARAQAPSPSPSPPFIIYNSAFSIFQPPPSPTQKPRDHIPAALSPILCFIFCVLSFAFQFRPTSLPLHPSAFTLQPSSTLAANYQLPFTNYPPSSYPSADQSISSTQGLNMTHAAAPNRHTWRFFRAGGFDQVRLDSGADIANLHHLDRKLWVALACPTRGIEFDHKTLDLIDTDTDGRIRAPEILAACKWACDMLKNPDDLIPGNSALPLAAISDATPESKVLHASAKQILLNLGKSDAAAITPDDTADTVKIFASTQFNGDGILPSDSTPDPALQSVIADAIICMGGETDRSGKPGITQPKLDLFFADAGAFANWHGALEAEPTKFPLGPNTAAGAAAVKAVATKIDDYFARCRLAAFDARAMGAVNRAEADYTPLGAISLSAAAAEIAAFPLAKIAPNIPLPLTDDAPAINPAWRTTIQTLRTQVLIPLLGDKPALNESDWATIVAKFAPFDAWLATKAGLTVEKLGLDRVRAILATDAKAQITALIAKDKALEPEATSIAEVDRLVRYHRDLHKLLINFVNFRDFYGRRERAVFQVGTLFLDQRSCDLCVRVDDAARHGLMAHLSRTYLAYCDCTRKGADGNLEKLTIAAAFTGGDSDNLMVGRNGIFFDRLGHDWDATITKIIENPISIRQAFFAPYKRAIRFVSEQMAKRAADADAAASARTQAAAGKVIDTTVGGVPPPPPAPPKPKIDVGAVAALGVAGGFIMGAVGTILTAFFGLGLWMPVGIIALLLAISGPSMLIAFFKLRQRNLGPILDANGWAVNAKAKVNIPFGRSLTGTPKLPPGSHRDMTDPFAEKHTGRNWTIVILILLAALIGLWYFGVGRNHWPDGVPKSRWVISQELAKGNRDEADQLMKDINKELQDKQLIAQVLSDKFKRLDELKPSLPEIYQTEIVALHSAVSNFKATPATMTAQ